MTRLPSPICRYVRHAAMLCVTVVVTLVLPAVAHAQADIMLSQYYESPAYYNPAAIGTTDNIRIRAGGRLQWVGIDNAPQTFYGTANMPFKFLGKRFGVGVMLQQSSEGLYNNLVVGAQFGYKIKLLKGELTGALQVGYLDEGFKGSKVVIPDNDDFHQGTDEAIPTTDVHGGALDLGVGIFYNHPKFWAGVSCTHVNSPVVTFSGDGVTSGSSSAEGGDATNSVKNFEFQASRTLYFMAGSNIPIKNTLFEVMPSIMVASDFNFYTGKIDARVRYNKFLTFGVGYRYKDALSATVGAEFKGIFVGYSYDYPLNAISKASSGSHEFVVGYSLKLDFSEKNKNRHKNIRIM